jgi:protein-S-isoprenylcysteine O-methyltransferase Ste14
MELEQRVEQLERENRVLKNEIRQTLLEVQRELSQEPAPTATPEHWRKRAWVLALLNTLLAVTLFSTVRVYASGEPWGLGDWLVPWLRGFYVALTFVWLLLQLYPVALLLQEEDRASQDIAWRNAGRAFASNPGLTLAVTVAVLGAAAISALFPPIWFGVVALLLVAVCLNAIVGWVRLGGQET